jgi:hypothetical protein
VAIIDYLQNMKILLKCIRFCCVVVVSYLLLIKVLSLGSNMWGGVNNLYGHVNFALELLSFFAMIICFFIALKKIALIFFFPLISLIINSYRYSHQLEIDFDFWFDPWLRFLCYFILGCSLMLDRYLSRTEV